MRFCRNCHCKLLVAAAEKLSCMGTVWGSNGVLHGTLFVESIRQKMWKIIVAGRQAPGSGKIPMNLRPMNIDALIEELVRYNATPKEVLKIKSCWILFFRVCKSQDYILNESLVLSWRSVGYTDSGACRKPDREANAEIMNLWKHMTTNLFQLNLFRGFPFLCYNLVIVMSIGILWYRKPN